MLLSPTLAVFLWDALNDKSLLSFDFLSAPVPTDLYPILYSFYSGQKIFVSSTLGWLSYIEERYSLYLIILLTVLTRFLFSLESSGTESLNFVVFGG